MDVQKDPDFHDAEPPSLKVLDQSCLANELRKSNEALRLALNAERQAREELLGLKNERQRREVAEAKAQQYRIITEAIPQIVWTADAEGEIDYFNSRWYQITERYPENSLGSAWFSEIHEDDRNDCKSSWKESTVSGKPFEVAARLRSAANDYRWILFRALPIKDVEKNIIKWFGTGTDIHNQKTFEIKLQGELHAERAASRVYKYSHQAGGQKIV
ncbi:MAG: hypothetical protein C5B53_11375 [Candidatus Melainabacteria bacterium]|nr:MAG: hypothetical protein C5B53_11375 [Candidatus Melainabacteria bacterium]